MAEMVNGIPVETFDPTRHVVVVRETREGRQLFVTLQSLMAAEDAIDAAAPSQPAPAVDLSGIEEKIAALLAERQQPSVTADELAAVEERIIRNVRDAIPPPQFPADVMQVLTDTAAALVAMKGEAAALAIRIADLEAFARDAAGTFATFKTVMGGGA